MIKTQTSIHSSEVCFFFFLLILWDMLLVLSGNFLGRDWNSFLKKESMPDGEYVFSLIHLL